MSLIASPRLATTTARLMSAADLPSVTASGWIAFARATRSARSLTSASIAAASRVLAFRSAISASFFAISFSLAAASSSAFFSASVASAFASASCFVSFSSACAPASVVTTDRPSIRTVRVWMASAMSASFRSLMGEAPQRASALSPMRNSLPALPSWQSATWFIRMLVCCASYCAPSGAVPAVQSSVHVYPAESPAISPLSIAAIAAASLTIRGSLSLPSRHSASVDTSPFANDATLSASTIIAGWPRVIGAWL